MSINSIPADLDRERLLILLEMYHQRRLSPDDARQLMPLIERIWGNALRRNDIETAEQMSTILIALNAYIDGRISLYDPPRFDRVAGLG